MFPLKYEFLNAKVKKLYNDSLNIDKNNSFILKNPENIVLKNSNLTLIKLKVSIDLSVFENALLIETFTSKYLLNNKCVVVPKMIDSKETKELQICIHNYAKEEFFLEEGSELLNCYILDNSKILKIV